MGTCGYVDHAAVLHAQTALACQGRADWVGGTSGEWSALLLCVGGWQALLDLGGAQSTSEHACSVMLLGSSGRAADAVLSLALSMLLHSLRNI